MVEQTSKLNGNAPKSLIKQFRHSIRTKYMYTENSLKMRPDRRTGNQEKPKGTHPIRISPVTDVWMGSYFVFSQ